MKTEAETGVAHAAPVEVQAMRLSVRSFFARQIERAEAIRIAHNVSDEDVT